MDTPSPAHPAASPAAAALDAPTRPAAAWDHPFLWLSAMGALSLLAPYLPIRSWISALLGTVGLTCFYVFFVVRLAASTARVFNTSANDDGPKPLSQVLGWCALAITLWAASEFGVKPALQAIMVERNGPLPEGLRQIGIANYTLRPLLLVAGATCGGVALSRLIKYPNMLGPLAGVSALIDIWGVLFGGIVSKLLTSPTSAPLAERAMAPLPSIGGASGAGGGAGIAIASVGTGDFLFLGLFFGVLWAHRMEVRRVAWLITPLVTLALLAIALDLVGHLPGLLFIGLGAAIPNLKYLRYTREENFALLYAGIFVAILTGGLFFAISSQLEDAPPKPAAKQAALK